MTNPDECEIFAGIAGIELPVSQFELGHGISLESTYAHVMAPYLAAFAKPETPGKHHPTPWKTVSGGLAHDINVQLHIPLETGLKNWFNRLDIVWLIVAMIRATGGLQATVPVVASESFSRIRDMKEEPFFWPVEMQHRRLLGYSHRVQQVSLHALEWIRDHWKNGGDLMKKHDGLLFALRALDQSIWAQTSGLGLVTVWGGLERLFFPRGQELSFRISAIIASFFEPPGENRMAAYKSIKSLYAARCNAAHGSSQTEDDAFVQSHGILSAAIRKIIENRHVPSKAELESALFGIDLNH